MWAHSTPSCSTLSRRHTERGACVAARVLPPENSLVCGRGFLLDYPLLRTCDMTVAEREEVRQDVEEGLRKRGVAAARVFPAPHLGRPVPSCWKNVFRLSTLNSFFSIKPIAAVHSGQGGKPSRARNDPGALKQQLSSVKSAGSAHNAGRCVSRRERLQ